MFKRIRRERLVQVKLWSSWRRSSLVGGLLVLIGCIPNSRAQYNDSVYALEFQKQDQLPADIKFYCAQSYGLNKCKEHALILRNVLKRYPMQALAPWSFVLVPAGEWGDLIRLSNGPEGSPAFSALRSRYTFMTEVLFAPTPLQQSEQMRLFRARGQELLERAVSHELAHALCGERNEWKTDIYASHLRSAAHNAGASSGEKPYCGE